MRRFTRLINAFSKKSANHPGMVRLLLPEFRSHPSNAQVAMKAGIVDHVWPIEEVVGLWE